MPKSQGPKIRGAICNVPIDTTDISNNLPRQADRNGLVIVKLKRKLEYRGLHMYTMNQCVLMLLISYCCT